MSDKIEKPDAKPKDPLAQVLAENAELKARLTNLEKVLALQIPVTTPLKTMQDRDEWFEQTKDAIDQPCEVRTQIEARRLWQEATEYPVSVMPVKPTGPKSGMPAVLVPARSPEEARGRYDKLCGITSVDTDKQKHVIGEPQPAPQKKAAA